MVNVSKIKFLAKASGIKLKFICSSLGFSEAYLSDVQKGKVKMSEENIRKVASMLDTSYEYLTDQADDPRSLVEIETAKIANSSRIKVQLAQEFAEFSESFSREYVDESKFGEMDEDIAKTLKTLREILKKPSAKKDLDDVLTYLEFIAKRGE